MTQAKDTSEGGIREMRRMPDSPDVWLWEALQNAWFRRRWALALAGFLGATGAVLAFLAPPTYRVQSVVSVVADQGAFAGRLGGQIGGLASLAGIDLGAADTSREEQIAILKSRGLARNYISKHALITEIFVDKWSPSTSSWKLGSFASPPSLEDAVDYFTTDILFVSDDRRTGLVTVRVDWRDPEVATRWASGIVEMANSFLRDRAREEADRSIAFLETELKKSPTLDVQSVIFRMIETSMQRQLLANVRPDFAFKTVEPPYPPDLSKPAGPSVVIQSSLGFILGLVLGFLVAAIVPRSLPK